MEIHLTDREISPSVISAADGTVRLMMSWQTPIEQALETSSHQISAEIQESLRSLFTSRDVIREYDMNDGVLVIRPSGNARTLEADS